MFYVRYTVYLCTIYCIPCTAYSILYSLYCTTCTILFPTYCTKCTMTMTVYCTLFTIYCMLDARCSFCILIDALYVLDFRTYNLQLSYC